MMLDNGSLTHLAVYVPVTIVAGILAGLFGTINLKYIGSNLDYSSMTVSKKPF